MATFNEVKDAIIDERSEQDKEYSGQVSWPGALLLINQLLDRARDTYRDNLGESDDDDILDKIRIICAIGLRAMVRHGNLTRPQAFTALSDERAAQDIALTRTLSVEGEIVLMTEELQRARAYYYDNISTGPATRANIVNRLKVLTAIGIRAMENGGAVGRRRTREI